MKTRIEKYGNIAISKVTASQLASEHCETLAILLGDILENVFTFSDVDALLVDVRVGAGTDVCSVPPELGKLTAPNLEMERAAAQLSWLVRESTVPIVLITRGIICGGACILALMADGLIASRESSFVHPFLYTGVVSAGGSTKKLSDLIGASRTKEFMWMPWPLHATVARDWGFVDDVLDDEQLIPSAIVLARRLAANREGVAAKRASLIASPFR